MNKGVNKQILLLTAAMFVAIGWVIFSFQQSLIAPTTPAKLTAVGERKPVEDFALKDENGKTVRLSDYKGQIVAMIFYSSW